MSEMTREVMRYKLNELRMMLNDGEHGEEQGMLVDVIKELDKDEYIKKSEAFDYVLNEEIADLQKDENLESTIERIKSAGKHWLDVRHEYHAKGGREDMWLYDISHTLKSLCYRMEFIRDCERG